MERGTIIEGNEITGFNYYGIYAYYQDSIRIKSNIIENSNNSASAYGIYMQYCDKGIHVEKNKIHVCVFGLL